MRVCSNRRICVHERNVAILGELMPCFVVVLDNRQAAVFVIDRLGLEVAKHSADALALSLSDSHKD